jgi:hypothetical protein
VEMLSPLDLNAALHLPDNMISLAHCFFNCVTNVDLVQCLTTSGIVGNTCIVFRCEVHLIVCFSTIDDCIARKLLHMYLITMFCPLQCS